MAKARHLHPELLKAAASRAEQLAGPLSVSEGSATDPELMWSLVDVLACLCLFGWEYSPLLQVTN